MSDKGKHVEAASLAAIEARLVKLRDWMNDFIEDGASTESVPELLAAAAQILDTSPVESTPSESLARADQLLTEAELVFTRAKYRNNVAVVDSAINKVFAKLEKAREQWPNITQQYAAAALAAVNGNGTEASKRLQRANQERAKAAMLVRQDKWNNALTKLNLAHEHLKEAANLLGSIDALVIGLTELRAWAPLALTLASQTLQSAQEHPANDKLAKTLAAASKLYQQAEQQREALPPNHWGAMQLALEAVWNLREVVEVPLNNEAAVHQELSGALLYLTITYLEITLAIVGRFIRDHERVVGQLPKIDMHEASSHYEQVHAGETRLQAGHARQALDKVATAYRGAQADFQFAQRVVSGFGQTGTVLPWGIDDSANVEEATSGEPELRF